MLRCAALALPLLGLAGGAAALPVTLTLDPSSVVLTAGQALSVDIVVDGLFDESEIAVESFDLELAFDTTRLQFTALSFGAGLGDPSDGGETFLLGPGSPNVSGVVELGEFSFLTEAQLLALQSAPFVLATIEFEALANPGSALLELVNLYGGSIGGVAGLPLGDALEAPSPLSVTLVPEPGALALLAAAGALLARRTRSARG